MKPPLCTATIKVVCAWCGAGMGSKPAALRLADLVSQGICEQCAARQASRDLTPESFASFDAGTTSLPKHSHGAPVGPTTAAVSTPPAGAAGIEFISVRRLAEVSGVSEYRLDTCFRPEEWAAPRDFRMASGRLIYAVAALPALITQLEIRGPRGAAARLREWLRSQEQETPSTPWYRKGGME